MADGPRRQRGDEQATMWRVLLVFAVFLGETVALQWFVGAYSSDYSAYASDWTLKSISGYRK